MSCQFPVRDHKHSQIINAKANLYAKTKSCLCFTEHLYPVNPGDMDETGIELCRNKKGSVLQRLSKLENPPAHDISAKNLRSAALPLKFTLGFARCSSHPCQVRSEAYQ